MQIAIIDKIETILTILLAIGATCFWSLFAIEVMLGMIK